LENIISIALSLSSENSGGSIYKISGLTKSLLPPVGDFL